MTGHMGNTSSILVDRHDRPAPRVKRSKPPRPQEDVVRLVIDPLQSDAFSTEGLADEDVAAVPLHRSIAAHLPDLKTFVVLVIRQLGRQLAWREVGKHPVDPIWNRGTAASVLRRCPDAKRRVPRKPSACGH